MCGMNNIDPSSISQRAVDAALRAQPVCEPWEAREIIAAALAVLMDESVDAICTAAERKLLDIINKADALFVWSDKDHSSLTYMRGFGWKPPGGHVDIQYGWLGEDGKSGDKVIRKINWSAGLNVKDFKAAAARGRAEDAAEATDV
jgi:hypothetical protein